MLGPLEPRKFVSRKNPRTHNIIMTRLIDIRSDSRLLS